MVKAGRCSKNSQTQPDRITAKGQTIKAIAKWTDVSGQHSMHGVREGGLFPFYRGAKRGLGRLSTMIPGAGPGLNST